MLAVVVEKQCAEVVRMELLNLNLFDKSRYIISKAGRVEIPVLSPPEKLSVNFTLVQQDKSIFKAHGLSFSEMKEYLKDVVGERAELIRGGWEMIGDVLIISLPEELYAEREKIGKAMLDFHPRAKTVILRKKISEPLRKPEAQIIAGRKKTVIIHRENGVIFKLNPLKVMFSAGNFSERKRMAYISSPEERILDMFSGIGQFCLPLAKYSSPEKVIAIEKRPETFQFLKENIKLNKLENVEARLGDNLEVSPVNFADRVLMGYFFSPENYLEIALRALRNGRGMLHFHAIIKKPELKVYGDRVAELVRKEGYEAKVNYNRIIKSYAPMVWHAVYDIEARSKR